MPAPGLTNEESDSRIPAEASPPGESIGSPTGTSKLVHRLALLTLCVAYLGIITGGVVTSTESGRVDKNWPSFEGNLLPSPSSMLDNPGLLVEHGHRLLMGSVGILALLTCIATLRKVKCSRIRKFSCGVVFLVLPPAIMGGLTVHFKLPPILSILHVALAMIFLCAVTLLTIITAPRWVAENTRVNPSKINSICSLSLFAVISVYVQIVLGAVPRHATLEPGGGGETLQTIGDLVHIVWAFAVFTVIILLAGKLLSLSKADRLLHPALGLLLLLFLQVALGFATFIFQTPPSLVVDEGQGLVKTGTFEILASSHQALGVLILMLSLLVCARSFRIRSLGLSRPEVPA